MNDEVIMDLGKKKNWKILCENHIIFYRGNLSGCQFDIKQVIVVKIKDTSW